MNTISLFVLYTLVAVAVIAHVFYFGVLTRPRFGLFSMSDYGIMAIASIGVGLIWILFVPTLLALGVARAAHALRARTGTLSLARTQHARAGS